MQTIANCFSCLSYNFQLSLRYESDNDDIYQPRAVPAPHHRCDVCRAIRSGSPEQPKEDPLVTGAFK